MPTASDSGWNSFRFRIDDKNQRVPEKYKLNLPTNHRQLKVCLIDISVIIFFIQLNGVHACFPEIISQV